jgi:transcriptional regulator with XRE-family HTH domain
LLLWDLREEGYTFREIGELFGMTKQRVSQIERKMILRATAHALKGASAALRPQLQSIRNTPTTWIRTITREEFEDRLARINEAFERQFIKIIERDYKRQRVPAREGAARERTEFRRIWPYVEAYGKRSFTFSKLVADFPQLSSEPHLAQLLSRLRKTGLLQKVGKVAAVGHNHPEVLMVEAPIERHAAAAIERLTANWSAQLRRLQMLRRPNRPNRSIEASRQWLTDKLLGEGISLREIEEIFGPREATPEPLHLRSL